MYNYNLYINICRKSRLANRNYDKVHNDSAVVESFKEYPNFKSTIKKDGTFDSVFSAFTDVFILCQ